MKKHLQEALRKQNKLRTEPARPVVRKEKPAPARATKPKPAAPTAAKNKDGES